MRIPHVIVAVAFLLLASAPALAQEPIDHEPSVVKIEIDDTMPDEPEAVEFQSTPRATPGSSFSWEMTAESLAEAQGYRYELEMDGGAPIVAVSVCGTGPTPADFTCTTPIPPITPGNHTVRVRAVDAPTGETPITGEWSDPLAFQMRKVPGKPKNLR